VQTAEPEATILGWLGNDEDRMDFYQVVGQDYSTALELTIITHDDDPENDETNTDLDFYILNEQQEKVSSGDGLGKVETAQIPAGVGEIFYIWVVHFVDNNEVPSNYVIKQTPSFATTNDQKLKMYSSSNRDFKMDSILIAPKPNFPIIAPKPSFPIKRFAESGTQNAITEAIADNYSGTVNVTAEELFAAAGLPSESNYNDDLPDHLKAILEKGKWDKAVKIIQSKYPHMFIEPNFVQKLHVQSFSKDPSYDTYQWWNFDVVNLPEGLNKIGAEVKPVNVAVLDTGSPNSADPAYERSIFDTQWGWDMEDDDNLADDIEFMQRKFSHGVHVGSIISQLNDGIDGNGFGARVTPLRVCNEDSCGSTFDAYLYLNGDNNKSRTSFARRSGGQPLHAINMSYGSSGSDSSASCGKLEELSNKGVLVVSSSGNEGVDSMNYPAACPTVFSVGATNGTDRRSRYSSTNPRVDFAAPGGEQSDWGSENSSTPDGVDDLVYAYAYQNYWVNAENNGNYMIGAQGTSMASPHGAGFLALVKYYYEDIVKPFESNPNLPQTLGYQEVELMLAANLLTNDVNKESREFDTVARPGWDEHLGYGIIDLDKAFKSIDAFGDGYFNDMNDLPYYQAESQVDLHLEDNFASTFIISPIGRAGEGFNEVNVSYISNFLDVTMEANTINVSKNPDYNWPGWVNTPITFDFPIIDGVELPYDGYELLSVSVYINLHLIGESFSASLPALKARLIDENGAVVNEIISSVTEGQGYFVFDELNPGTYSMTIGSDINGDNSWGGPGEMTGASDTFEITDSNVADISVMLAPLTEGE
tara:strand:+ start:181 stop:2631 length:2451 start_codon:yes stop_codon:yes gene_type:complete